MTDAEREALIDALERAEGPDRDLDFAIAAAVGWPDAPYSHAHARRYTESIDAALTLVPEGAGIELHRYWITRSIADAVDVALTGPERGRVWSAMLRWGTDGQYAESEDVPGAAIAVCIAALKARLP